MASAVVKTTPVDYWILPRICCENVVAAGLYRFLNDMLYVQYIAWTGLLITFCLVIIIWFPISLMRWIMRGGGKVEVRLEQIERDWYVRFD